MNEENTEIFSTSRNLLHILVNYDSISSSGLLYNSDFIKRNHFWETLR